MCKVFHFFSRTTVMLFEDIFHSKVSLQMFSHKKHTKIVHQVTSLALAIGCDYNFYAFCDDIGRHLWYIPSENLQQARYCASTALICSIMTVMAQYRKRVLAQYCASTECRSTGGVLSEYRHRTGAVAAEYRRSTGTQSCDGTALINVYINFCY